MKRPFSSAQHDWPRVVIIGAGFAGIGAGIRLRHAGVTNIVILEKSDRIGGTWRDNSYPGAACDIPAHLYSFSFMQAANWTRKYPPQAEILNYLEDCVRRSELQSCIRFGAEVAGADYDSRNMRWSVRLTDGSTLEAEILIAACGQMHRPYIPDFPGRESFAGPSFHSAQWRHDCDLKNRAISIVGSAASAIQIAPAIVWDVRTLTIFQRTANWYQGHWDRAYPRWAQAIFGIAAIRRLQRWQQYLAHEVFFLAFRTASVANRIASALARSRIRRNVADDRLCATLTPTYPIGCKRVLRASGYLRLFKYDTVSLISDPIERITAEGIVTKDGRLHAADVIVYATGFQSTEFLAPMQLRGRGGALLADAWSLGAGAYLGMTVPNFPNLFILYGPNTNVGHNSVIFMIECQVSYIVKLLRHMRQTGAREIEVRGGVLERFSRLLERRMAAMVWSGDCRSFYKGPTGRVVGIWPFSTMRYWWMTIRPRLGDYLFRNGSTQDG